MADVDPALWAEAKSEARSIIQNSFLGNVQKNLSDAYQDGQADLTEHNLTVNIYNRKLGEHNRRAQDY